MVRSMRLGYDTRPRVICLCVPHLINGAIIARDGFLTGQALVVFSGCTPRWYIHTFQGDETGVGCAVWCNIFWLVGAVLGVPMSSM